MTEVPADKVLRDRLGHPVPCGQEECNYGIQECVPCPDNPDRRLVDSSWLAAVESALEQAERVDVLAYRLIEEGVFSNADKALAWADAAREKGYSG